MTVSGNPLFVDAGGAASVVALLAVLLVAGYVLARIARRLERRRVRETTALTTSLQQANQELQRIASLDPVTGLSNRSHFEAGLRGASETGHAGERPWALLFVDLDGFKSVNDRLGHAAGDAALVAVAELFLANLRESDAVGRLGGDEFALLMLHAGYEEGRAKARQLSEALKTEGFVWDGHRTELGGSFGVRAWDGHTDAEVWLTEADAAMWVRKKGR